MNSKEHYLDLRERNPNASMGDTLVVRALPAAHPTLDPDRVLAWCRRQVTPATALRTTYVRQLMLTRFSKLPRGLRS